MSPRWPAVLCLRSSAKTLRPAFRLDLGHSRRAGTSACCGVPPCQRAARSPEGWVSNIKLIILLRRAAAWFAASCGLEPEVARSKRLPRYRKWQSRRAFVLLTGDTRFAIPLARPCVLLSCVRQGLQIGHGDGGLVYSFNNDILLSIGRTFPSSRPSFRQSTAHSGSQGCRRRRRRYRRSRRTASLTERARCWAEPVGGQAARRIASFLCSRRSSMLR